ncbi:ClpXP adapter SpxH family protein [Bacillus alveayuensis]|uniref:ClpXP adapter protein SpxH n=1 Tax=Aeribacillus alveayuensis TaxID=279215 RepID=A0ABT9VN89_9BACI|nr:putative DsbA family dithiol-disulfide isomerase [Bacillus alveayuensis]
MNKNHSLDQHAANFFSHCHGNPKKPLEVYMFIDPLCPECWALEPFIKKLLIEYGRFFTLRHILSGRLASLNLTKKRTPENIAQSWEKTASLSGMSCDGTLWFENPISSPYTASLAIKAAELQGRKAGIRFLRKLQEVVFLEKQNVSNEKVLLEIAKSVNLDVDEFQNDLFSTSAMKALQCDFKITTEMDVHEIPSLIFFHCDSDKEGLKITGLYPYETYVNVLEELIGHRLKPSQIPPLEMFLKFFKFVGTEEIAVVYNMTRKQVEREMKRFQLMKKVERVPVKYGTFWRYIE